MVFSFFDAKYLKPLNLIVTVYCFAFFLLENRSILTHVFQSEELKCCLSEMFFK